MPDVFDEKHDQEVSFFLCPEEWGEAEIGRFVMSFPVNSGAKLGVLEVTSEDFLRAGIHEPVSQENPGQPFSELHHVTPLLSDEERAKLAKAVELRLPNALRSSFVKAPKGLLP